MPVRDAKTLAFALRGYCYVLHSYPIQCPHLMVNSIKFALPCLCTDHNIVRIKYNDRSV